MIADVAVVAAPAPCGPARTAIRWMVTVAGTAASTGALEVMATTAGAILVASRRLDARSHTELVVVLAITYLLWVAGLRVNLAANWRLLEQTGACTNLPSKMLFELARLRSNNPRVQRAASAVGYVATELVKEAPYYAGAFGTAVFSDTIDSKDALVFLAGTNVGAALYEYGVARLSRLVLDRRSHEPATGDVRSR